MEHDRQPSQGTHPHLIMSQGCTLSLKLITGVSLCRRAETRRETMSQKWWNGCQYQSVNFLPAVQAFSESPGCPWSVCLYGGGPSVPMQVDTLQALPAVSHYIQLPCRTHLEDTPAGHPQGVGQGKMDMNYLGFGRCRLLTCAFELYLEKEGCSWSGMG